MIVKGFMQLLNEKPQKDYIEEKMRSIKAAAENPENAEEILAAIEQPVTVGNIIAAGNLSADMGKSFKRLFGNDASSDDKDELRSPCAGFFCSGVDGWESLSPYALDASPDFPENAVGRIVRGGWFFVTEPEDSGSFYAGQTLTLTLDGVGSYPAVCCGKNGGTVVLRCREGLEDVLSLRFVKASLSPGGATGYKLPASAVGKDENGEFVYVLKAGIPKRAPVKTVCAKDGFYLVQSAAFGSGAEILTKYDES